MSARTLTVPAAEANRSFSKLLRAAREGTRITITSHGEPVAELGPVGLGQTADDEKRRSALAALQQHWATVTPKVIGRWTREELYDLD